MPLISFMSVGSPWSLNTEATSIVMSWECASPEIYLLVFFSLTLKGIRFGLNFYQSG